MTTNVDGLKKGKCSETPEIQKVSCLKAKLRQLLPFREGHTESQGLIFKC